MSLEKRERESSDHVNTCEHDRCLTINSVDSNRELVPQEDYCISKECKRILASYMLMYNRIMYIHVCTYLLILCVCVCVIIILF